MISKRFHRYEPNNNNKCHLKRVVMSNGQHRDKDGCVCGRLDAQQDASKQNNAEYSHTSMPFLMQPCIVPNIMFKSGNLHAPGVCFIPNTLLLQCGRACVLNDCGM